MNTMKEVRLVFRDTFRLFQLAWAEKHRLLLFTGVAVLIASITPFIQNFAIGQMLNELVGSAGTGEFSEGARFFLLLVLCAGGAFAVSNTMQFFFKTVLYKELFQFLTVLIHEKIAYLDIATHEDPKRKDLITKVQENAMWRAPDYMQRMAYLIQNFLEVAFATVVFISADRLIGALIFLASVPRLWVDIRYNHNLWNVETEVAEVRRKFWFARWFLVDVRALIEVKLFQNVGYFVKLLGEHLGLIKRRELEAERRNLWGQLASLVLTEGVAVVAIVTFVQRVVDGQMAVGTLTFYLTSLATFRMSLNSLSQNIGSQFRDGKFVRDMFDAFDLKPTLPVVKSNGNKTLDQIHEVIFDNVSFAYPGTNKLILKGINLRIPGGATLGLVAENGSGKSTLAKLLCRIYDPTEGRILVNGTDIREFDLDYWQSMMGVMLQEYGHYEHLDVQSAIRLGRTSLNGNGTQQAVEHAALAGDAHEFILGLPRQYETTLGRSFEDGAELSGGEYQKLAIARMFYRQAQMAIFDEPTSAIDGEAEARIFERILGELPECTKILISHRYYTLRKADLICLIEDGRITECGSHDELMALGGTYASRYLAQAAEYN